MHQFLRQQFRSVMESHIISQDLLLHHGDLHPSKFTPQNLHVMKKGQFNGHFMDKMGMEWPLFKKSQFKKEKPHRLLAFVLFAVNNEDTVVSFPFVVDTGAPEAVYMGGKMEHLLK